jgi:hypothetical protein
MGKELTGPQIINLPAFDGELGQPRTDITYEKLREMRLDPTISLARRLTIAPVLASQWSVEEEEGAPEGAKEFISEQMQPIRIDLLEAGFLGCLDFGWQPFEKVYKLNAQGQVIIDKIKPLLQDLTIIIVDPDTGAYEGLQQTSDEGSETSIAKANAVLLNIDVEGTNWYGRSTLANAEAAYDSWLKSDSAADRYGSKVAGAHWVVHYPVGKTPFGAGGTLTDNYEIARAILTNLQAAGAVCLPSSLSAFTDTVDATAQPQWRIELLSDSSGGATFTDRQKYLDALKVRALDLPERAVLEGQFGTKAEAETHASLAITGMDMRHRGMVRSFNAQIVNDLLTFNYGPDAVDSVYVEPAPITDLALQFLRTTYIAFLTDESSKLQEMAQVDFEAFRDRLGIPTLPQTDIDAPGYVPQDV